MADITNQTSFRIQFGMPGQIRKVRAKAYGEAVTSGLSSSQATEHADRAVREHYYKGISTLPSHLQPMAHRVARQHIKGY